MANKEFTSREKGMIKNAAKAVYPAFEKLLKLEEQAKKLNEEIEKQRNFVDQMEAGIMALTGGYRSTELIKKEMITVGEGEKAVRKANYTFRYGDNVLPVYANSEDITPENIASQPLNPEPINPEPINTNIIDSNIEQN